MSSFEYVSELPMKFEDIKTIEQFAGVDSNPELIYREITNLYRLRNQVIVEMEAVRKEIEFLGEDSRTVPKINDKNITSLLKTALFSNPFRSSKISLPPVFSSFKKDFFTGKEAMLLKRNANANHFPSEQSKMIYIYS